MSKRRVPFQGKGAGGGRSKSSRSTSHFSEVPDDVMANILSYLPKEDVERLAKTSKSIRRGVKEQRDMAEQLIFLDECRRLTDNYLKCGLQRVGSEHCEEKCKTDAGDVMWMRNMDLSWVPKVRYAQIAMTNSRGETLRGEGPLKSFDVTVTFANPAIAHFNITKKEVYVESDGKEIKLSHQEGLARLQAAIKDGNRPERVWAYIFARQGTLPFKTDLEAFNFMHNADGVFSVTAKLFERNPDIRQTQTHLLTGITGRDIQLTATQEEIEMLVFGPPFETTMSDYDSFDSNSDDNSTLDDVMDVGLD